MSGLRYYEVTLLASMDLRIQIYLPVSPSPRTFNASTAFDSTSSFPNPDIVNAIGNPNDAAATFAQQRAKLNPTGDAVHRIPKPVLTQETAALGLASDKSRSGNNSPIQVGLGRSIHRAPTSFPQLYFPLPLPDGGAAPGDLNRFSPVIDNSRASMVNEHCSLHLPLTTTNSHPPSRRRGVE
ncbi:hypothetical protein H4582DRAFT_2012927 [Lactarius indigo]|nr:hypothetical protein H4582DRAFT_2012927 [Lactarius indigo]